MKNLLSRLDRGSLALLRQIGALAQDRRESAYLVGGPVRDLMLKRPNTDLDISVEGQGIRLAQVFAACHKGACVMTYPAFKTATVRLSDGRVVDFAASRKERYVRGGAFPAVVPANIRQDLFRRDFTINAMAITLNPQAWGRLLDPFGALADLRSKRIRVLHAKSFFDDPTRILRAARFKTRFAFSIERKTLKLLKASVDAKVLDTIKPQRYLKEFDKILKEPQSKAAIKCLRSWKAYAY